MIGGSACRSGASGGKYISLCLHPSRFLHWGGSNSSPFFSSSFWHQGSRQKFLAPANFVAFSLLRIARGTLLARYTILSLAFLISGLHHQLCDAASGVPWREAGALRFFLMQAAGIMFEDAIQGLYRYWNAQRRTEARPSGFKRVVGCSWLFFWLFWTTPAWIYPVAERSTGEGILPFSLVGYLLDGR